MHDSTVHQDGAVSTVGVAGAPAQVFMTATERVDASPSPPAEGEDRKLFSMDNERDYGKLAYKLSLAKAVNKGLVKRIEVRRLLIG